MPERIQLSRARGWRKPDGAIVVARPGKWGNPYRVSDHGRDEAVRLYREHLKSNPELMAAARKLAGHDLACWCRLTDPCHADVLLEVANDGWPLIAFVRVQRFDTPDLHSYAAVRRDELAAIIAGSGNVVTVQECELRMPPDITAELVARLGAILRPVQIDVGDVTGDTWVSGPLKGQSRPQFWDSPHRPPYPMFAGFRCTHHSNDGYRCYMYGEGVRPCPAHQPGIRWEALPPLDDEDGEA